MDTFNELVGKKISKIRKARGFTLVNLSMKITELGYNISDATLSQLEHGARTITAEQIFYIAKALDCSIANIYPMDDSLRAKNISDAVKSESKEIQDILHYTFNEWDGNTTALWYYVGLYVALPRDMRFFLSSSGVSIYQIAEDMNRLNPDAPPIDAKMLAREANRLYNDKEFISGNKRD